MESAGLNVVRVARMPVTTGYRPDWKPFLSILERAGLASGYAYLAVKGDERRSYSWLIPRDANRVAY